MTMPAVIPDLDAPIVPGVSAAGILVGSEIEKLLAQTRPVEILNLDACTLYSFRSVKVWAVEGLVNLVGVNSRYKGLLYGVIGIGSTIAAVEEVCGCKVEEDEEDNLVATDKPGWCFETETWSGDQTLAKNRNACINEIFVYDTHPLVS